MLTFFLVSGGSLWLFVEFVLSLLEKMQTQEILRILRLPELGDLGQFFRSLSATTLVSMGALAAILAYWFTHRPKALQPPCNLLMQSEEVEGMGPVLVSGSPTSLTSGCPTRRWPTGLNFWGLDFSSTIVKHAPISLLVFLHKIGQSGSLRSWPATHIPWWWSRSMTPWALELSATSSIQDCGQENHHAPVPPQPDDLSIVCFTSGTTGNPKGAMLTHGNVVADFSGFLKVTESQWAPTCADVHISYLPLAHMFERMVQSVVYCHGGRVGFFQGDIRLLSDDMKALCPTIFPVVPRLLNRMYDKIFSQANTPLKRWLLEFAAKRKQAEVRSGIIRNDSIWDELFFNKIQASLGGCVRMIVTGAAPASPTVLGFLRAALGCQVYEGYGQTECTAGCTFTTPGDWTSGHVGAPLPCNHIKLVDVEELNYWACKGEGEICVRGPNVFKGYLKDPDRTKEALDSDGWLHTGDIGKWLPAGTLKVIDRKKHIFKLAQGEYVAPEKIENIYIRSQPVAQIYVHGDSLKAFLVGIVVPDPEVMPSWAQKRGIEGTYADLCTSKDLKKAILEDMVRLGKESGLHSFEQVKAIHIHSDMFSVQNGLLTPTLKAKRPELREYFKKQIEELYSISM
ncbi:PREDICTED: long-chain-fatty-acid--CoA ligase 6 isoform X5 [Cercocebus atys]|uniref:long-chain-fatty-acid--CoA ligase 6 isoform X5 n=1 Tax=Cercocebus atys TaxID=9531 RepID=UPI0005F3B547|nr:PREDICTED: long-chain-fatty-acid--CoA ligase 6 isoform X5 [Cercocebus atys]